VLEDAVHILIGAPSHPSDGRHLVETAQWVTSDDTKWPFSFLNVCEALDIDPLRLRERLRPWISAAPIRRSSAVVR
jgi:hypothetical protein